MSALHKGDRVQFNVPFSRGDTVIQSGDIGEVQSIGLFYAVLAKGQLWLARPYEIRPAGTEITDEHRCLIHAADVTLKMFEQWLESGE